MKFTIRFRLLLSFGFLSLVIAALGIFSIYSAGLINDSNDELAENTLPSVDYSHSINTAAANYRIKEYRHILTESADEMQSMNNEMDQLNSEIQENISKYKKLVLNDADQKLIDTAEKSWESYRQISNQMRELSIAGKNNEALSLMYGDSKEAYDALSEDLLDLVDFNEVNANTMKQKATEVYQNTLLILIITIVSVVAISIVISLWITNSIVKPINRLIQVADDLAVGNVNVNVETNLKDEIGNLMRSFSRMVDNIRNQAMTAERIAAGDLTMDVEVRSEQDLLGQKLKELVDNNNEILSNINMASEQVAAGSKQVSDSSMALSQGATEQASSIEELTASLEEVSTQTKLNAQNANQANELANAMKTSAVQGNNQMKDMLGAMMEINEASANISKIIKAIDDIAFQTNILALNAAVEAARAGQHGKGFAVVAEEVRNLAARSAEAAKETTALIESSIKKTDGGTRIAKDTAEALSHVVSGIEKVANLVEEIAIASNEQASGIGQINQGILQISQVIQSNSSTSEESAAASEELSGQAELLKAMVSKYQLK